MCRSYLHSLTLMDTAIKPPHTTRNPSAHIAPSHHSAARLSKSQASPVAHLPVRCLHPLSARRPSEDDANNLHTKSMDHDIAGRIVDRSTADTDAGAGSAGADTDAAAATGSSSRSRRADAHRRGGAQWCSGRCTCSSGIAARRCGSASSAGNGGCCARRAGCTRRSARSCAGGFTSAS